MLKPFYDKLLIEAGVDEAGRGCLAGPVVAAAVILPKNFRNKILNDSKQLSKKQRDKLRIIIEKKAIAWAVGEVDNEEIDKINILNASFAAMHIAISKLSVIPEHLLIDGNRFKSYSNIPHKCIIQGDATYMNIAAASVLAKTYRDEIMEKFAAQYPVYGWHTNMGYATEFHRDAIKVNGLTPLHRMSFRQFSDQLELFEDYIPDEENSEISTENVLKT
jgi:ribonuclease HII